MSHKILIIESDANFSEELGSIINRFRFEFEAVDDGDEGIQLARIESPAVVVLGLMDGKGAGYGICSKLRRRVPGVPVVIITPEDEVGSSRRTKHQSLRTKADAYLTRPLSVSVLADTFEALVGGRIDRAGLDMAVELGVANVVEESTQAGTLFDADELAAIEKEAEIAFDSLLAETDEIALEVDAGDFVAEEILDHDGAVEVDVDEQILEVQDSVGARLEMPMSALHSEEFARHNARLERDNRDLRAQNRELSHELRRTRDELTRRVTEVISQRQTDSAVKLEAITLQEELNRHQHKILELRDEVTTRDRKIFELSDELERTRQDKETIAGELEDLDRREQATTSVRAEAETELEELRVRLAEWEAALEMSTAELASAKAWAEALEAKSTDDDERIEELTATIAAQRAAHKKVLAKLERSGESTVDVLRAEHAAALDAAEVLHHESIEAQRTALVEQQEARIAEIEQARADAVDAVEQARHALEIELEHSRGNHQIELETLTSAHAEAIAKSRSEIGRLEEDLEATQELLDEEARRATELDDKLERLRAEQAEGRDVVVAERDERIDALHSQLAEAAERIEEVEGQVAQTRREADDLRGEIEAREGRISELEAERAKLEYQSEALRDAQTRAGEVVKTAREALDSAEAFVEWLRGSEAEPDALAASAAVVVEAPLREFDDGVARRLRVDDDYEVDDSLDVDDDIEVEEVELDLDMEVEIGPEGAIEAEEVDIEVDADADAADSIEGTEV